jgi:hypothetical protein
MKKLEARNHLTNQSQSIYMEVTLPSLQANKRLPDFIRFSSKLDFHHRIEPLLINTENS